MKDWSWDQFDYFRAAPRETVCSLSPTDAGGKAHLKASYSWRDGPSVGAPSLLRSASSAIFDPPVLKSHPFRANGTYIVPKTLRERVLRRFGCGAFWKMMLRESFSIWLSC